jgi:anaerobic dimethyl sulfoxide reductase subunit B (iron-sulfur subunit)
MREMFFVFDPAACFGCSGCVAACINENTLTGGDHWRRIFKLPPVSGNHDTRYLSLACNHCEEPACVRACPTEAMEKRESDGIVIHHEDRCMGCRYCQMACPYGAIIWMEEKKVVSKCRLCVDRLEKGQKPACVETCFGNALEVVTREELEKMENLAREVPGFEYLADMKPKIRFRIRK